MKKNKGKRTFSDNANFEFASPLHFIAPGPFNPDQKYPNMNFPAVTTGREIESLSKLPGRAELQAINTFNGVAVPESTCYPEYTDKSDNTREDRTSREIPFGPSGPSRYKNVEFYKNFNTPEYLPKCSGIFIAGRCEGGHRHLKAAVCNREWCTECGKEGSIAHRRRIGRWYKKYHTFESVGYLVVTVPAELRNEFKDQKALADFRKYVRRKLQRTDLKGNSQVIESQYEYTTKAGKVRRGTRRKEVGYSHGFIRYHYAGDCDNCKGAGCIQCRQTGAGSAFKPHLNCLLPEGYVSKKKLALFRADVAEWFKKRFKLERAPKGNIFYNYSKGEAQKGHRLKYVTRATFLKYDKEVAEVLHGYHTASSWGKFPKPQAGDAHTDLIQRGCCATCLEGDGDIQEIQWGHKLTREEAAKVVNTYRHVENGYYVGYNDIDIVLRN